MINWGSAILGAASSLLVSMFMLHYQNWKANVRDRVSIFYRARKQIRLNLEALDLSRSAPDRKAILQEKIQFLPAYPFSNDDHTDEAFRALSEYYDTELLYAISGDINYSEFEKITSEQLRLLDLMLNSWTAPLQDGTILYYIKHIITGYIHDLKLLWMYLKSKIPNSNNPSQNNNSE